MTGLRLARRLFAGLAGLTLGLAGVIATAAPAQATSPLETKVEYGDVCHGTYVAVIGGSEQATYQWTGLHHRPRGELLAAAGRGRGHPSRGAPIWSSSPTRPGRSYRDLRGRAGRVTQGVHLDRPRPSAPSCRSPPLPPPRATPTRRSPSQSCWSGAGQQSRIPVVPRDPMPTAVQPQSMGYPSASPMPREPVTPPGSGDAPSRPSSPLPPLRNRATASTVESVEPGSIHTVAPGTHYVELVISGLTIQVWEITSSAAPECEDPGDEPGDARRRWRAADHR